MFNKFVAQAKQLIHRVINNRIVPDANSLFSRHKAKSQKNEDNFYRLNYEHSIWIEEEELGTEKLVEHKNKSYNVKIPPKIDKKVTLRLKGLGKTWGGKTGDLFLRLYLNKGRDLRKNLWLSERAAKFGAKKKLALAYKKIKVTIPEDSYHGLVISLKGLVRLPSADRHKPSLPGNRGNLLVKLFVYPDDITPNYGSFSSLSTDDMVLEGWVYRKIDEIVQKMGKSAFQGDPIHADTIADTYNEYGWRGIFRTLVKYLKLTQFHVKINKSDSIPTPGSCQRTTTRNRDDGTYSHNYTITINEKFISNPFLVAAIIAHELCHLVYHEKIDDRTDPAAITIKSEEATMEEERMVDLLVFMFKLGEFQLRASRDQRLTLGYFNQRIFDRMQVIVSRKWDLS